MKRMNKAITLFLSLFVLSGCGETGQPNSSDSSYELVVPGNDRVWWYDGFDTYNEAIHFLANLKSAGKNGDFHIGLSCFDIPSQYKIFTIRFSGHINLDTSNKEDIYSSVYDRFWIPSIYQEDTDVLPIYNSFNLYFFPFYGDYEEFSNDQIECTFDGFSEGPFEASFTYAEKEIMRVELSRQSHSQIDDKQMLRALAENYRFQF